MNKPKFQSKEEIISYCEIYGVNIINKEDSTLMRMFSWFFFLIGGGKRKRRFIDGVWTTFNQTIYYPSRYDLDEKLYSPETYLTWEHEFYHVDQQRQFGILFYIAYALVPLPFGLAYYRWAFEREPYLRVNIEKGGMSVERAIDILGSVAYGWAWPKRWMKKWFDEKLSEG